MADIIIKVSADRYTQAITELDDYAGKLSTELTKLQNMRKQLEGFFVSKALSGPVREMIQNKEKEVQNSIESIRIQIAQIKEQMNVMSRAESSIESKVKDAASTGAKIFQ